MAFSKVTLNGDTLMDVTQKTVTAATMLSGTTALKNDGTDVTGSIASKSSSDLTVSGATVTAPAGYYASLASKSVATGAATTPATTITANPSMSVVVSAGKNLFDMDCLLEADGWVEENGDYYGQIRRVYEEYGTSTGVPVFGEFKTNTQYTVSMSTHIDALQSSNGLMVSAHYSDSTYNTLFTVPNSQTSWARSSGTTTAGKTVTAIVISYYSGGEYVWHIKEAQIEEGTSLTDYTPYAMQAAVNATVSASQSVTPTVSAGYVSTGTAGTVTVSGNGSETIILSDLVSGTKTITSNGTDIDVAKYASVDVNVSSGSSVDVEPLSVTTNGTYTAPTGTAYSPVTVNVSGGGSTTPASPKDVNFIDYDGTILYSYTKAEFAQLTALPANPDHSSDDIPLTSQGWNWTLAQIKAQLTAQPNDPVTVGQMYVTTDGKTYIEIELHEGRLSPYLGIAVNGTVVVDWGDNTATSTVTGSGLTTQIRTLHVYAAAGRYTISISVSSGSFAFYGTSAYTLLNKSSSTGNQNRVYSNAVQSVRIGNDVNIGDYAFYYCQSLALITMPSSVTSIAFYAFYGCYSLASITIPSEIIRASSFAFGYCYSLKLIAFSSGIIYISNGVFYNCYSLTSITMPSGIIDIGQQAFYNCYGLSSITVPSDTTGVATQAFYNCYGLAKIRFLRTTPPTVANSNAFTNIPTDCVISVPTGKKSDYTGATNYPDSGTYTYIEE